jgi:acyl-coenzyme A synthetase/AMP-(fatty) acid ligase
VLVDWPGVEDAAVFGYENKAGIQEVGAALVVADDFDIAVLREGLLKKLGPSRCPSRFFRVNKILRNRAGKPMRGQLSRQITEWVAKQETDAG